MTRIPIDLGPGRSYSMADPEHPLVALRSLLDDYRHLHTTAPTAQSAVSKLRALRVALLGRTHAGAEPTAPSATPTPRAAG